MARSDEGRAGKTSSKARPFDVSQRSEAKKARRRPSGDLRKIANEWVVVFAGKDAARFDLRSDLEFAKAIEKGFPTRAIDAALKSGILEQEDVHQLVVSKRTFQRRKDEHKPLNTVESDKLARLVRVIARTEAVLGDSAKATSWIRESNRALQRKRPIDLLATDGGARAVEKILGRIEHGVFS